MRLVERSQQEKAKDQRRTAKGSIGARLLVGVALVLMLGPSSFGQEPFSFVQLCDPQLCRYGCEHDAAMFRLAVEYINALQPDFVLICGDLTDMKKGKDSLDDFLEIKNQ